MSEVIKPIMTDDTGKQIVEALLQTDIVQERVSEINAGAEVVKEQIVAEAGTDINALVESAKQTAVADFRNDAEVVAQEVIATIPEDYTALSNNVNLLNGAVDNRIKKFYTSNLGATHIEDSDDGRIKDLKVYGKSEQESTSGKNLLNPTLESAEQNGITCTRNADGTYTLNGTASGNAIFEIAKFKADANMKIVGCPFGGDYEIYLAYKGDEGWGNVTTDIGNGALINTSGTDDGNVIIVIANGRTANNLIFKPMITTDLNATYNDFEPYTGGIPSPNPQFPQEIKSVVNPVVESVGKNLCNPTINELDKYNLEVGKTYTISVSDNIVKDIKVSVEKNDSTDEALVEGGLGVNKVSFVYNNDKNWKLYLFDGSWNLIELKDSKVQLEEGNQVTSFEPYKSTKATLSDITLYGVPVESGGNVTIDGQQYISDYVNVEKGVVVRKVIKFTLPSNASEYRYVDIGGNNLFVVSLPSAASYSKGICNAYINGYINIDNSITIDGSTLYIKDDTYSNINDFINNVASKGVDIYYVDYNSNNEPLTPSQIEELKSLKSYYPVTNLTVSSELDGHAEFIYPCSIEKTVEYVKRQLGDERKFIYDMADVAYINSEYAAVLAELN